MSLHKIRIDQTRSQHDAGPSHEAHSTSCSRQQAVARSVHILPVLAVLAAKLLLAKQCFVQCARQQLIGARSDATVCARLPELFKAASSSHAQSVCHVLFVCVSMTLCVVHSILSLHSKRQEPLYFLKKRYIHIGMLPCVSLFRAALCMLP